MKLSNCKKPKNARGPLTSLQINENVLFKSVLFRGGVTPNSRTVAGWVDAAGLRMIKVSLSRLIYLVRFN